MASNCSKYRWYISAQNQGRSCRCNRHRKYNVPTQDKGNQWIYTSRTSEFIPLLHATEFDVYKIFCIPKTPVSCMKEKESVWFRLTGRKHHHENDWGTGTNIGAGFAGPIKPVSIVFWQEAAAIVQREIEQNTYLGNLADIKKSLSFYPAIVRPGRIRFPATLQRAFQF